MCIRAIERETWMERLEIKFRAYGHENIRARHKSTLEITKDSYISPRGDCIIAVNSEYAVADLPSKFKDFLRNNETVVIIKLESSGIVDVIYAHGSEDLLLDSRSSMVIRKSRYIDSRTLAINADKAAMDIDRRLINKLKNPRSIVEIKITLLSSTTHDLYALPEHI